MKLISKMIYKTLLSLLGVFIFNYIFNHFPYNQRVIGRITSIDQIPDRYGDMYTYRTIRYSVEGNFYQCVSYCEQCGLIGYEPRSSVYYNKNDKNDCITSENILYFL